MPNKRVSTYARTTRRRRYDCVNGVLQVQSNNLPAPNNSLPLARERVNEEERVARRLKRMQDEVRRRAVREEAAMNQEKDIARRVTILVRNEHAVALQEVEAANRNWQLQMRSDLARYREEMACEHACTVERERNRADVAIAEGFSEAHRLGIMEERDDPSNHIEGWQVNIFGPMLDPKPEKNATASIGMQSTIHGNLNADSGSGLLNSNLSLIERPGDDEVRSDKVTAVASIPTFDPVQTSAQFRLREQHSSLAAAQELVEAAPPTVQAQSGNLIALGDGSPTADVNCQEVPEEIAALNNSVSIASSEPQPMGESTQELLEFLLEE